MEYFFGSIITLAITIIVLKVFKQESKDLLKVRVTFNQSSTYEMIKHLFPTTWAKEPLDTQASNYLKRKMVRVIFTKSNAYWIKDNAVYEAEILDGSIKQESTKKVDIHAMNDVQLKKIQFIVEKLTEGLTDENGNPRNRSF